MYDYDLIGYALKNNEYKRLGSGSSRIVYDLNDGNVIKVAKNDKGFDQNMVEYTLFNSNNYFATVVDASTNYKYLIMTKADRILRGPKQLRTAHNCKTDNELREKLFNFAVDYDLIIGDLMKPSSWGIFGNTPLLVDFGLTDSVYYTHYSFKVKQKQRRVAV